MVYSLILFALILHGVGFYKTGHAIIKHGTNLSFWSWLLWSLITAVGCYLAYTKGKYLEAALCGFFTIGQLSIAILLVYKSKIGFGISEGVAVILCGICIASLLILDPSEALIVTGISIFLVGIPNILILRKEMYVGLHVQTPAKYFWRANVVFILASWKADELPVVALFCLLYWSMFYIMLPPVVYEVR